MRAPLALLVAVAARADAPVARASTMTVMEAGTFGCLGP